MFRIWLIYTSYDQMMWYVGYDLLTTIYSDYSWLTPCIFITYGSEGMGADVAHSRVSCGKRRTLLIQCPQRCTPHFAGIPDWLAQFHIVDQCRHYQLRRIFSLDTLILSIFWNNKCSHQPCFAVLFLAAATPSPDTPVWPEINVQQLFVTSCFVSKSSF